MDAEDRPKLSLDDYLSPRLWAKRARDANRYLFGFWCCPNGVGLESGCADHQNLLDSDAAPNHGLSDSDLPGSSTTYTAKESEKIWASTVRIR